MIKNKVQNSLATKVNSCIQIFTAEGGGKSFRKWAIHLNQVQRISSTVKRYVMQAHRCIHLRG